MGQKRSQPVVDRIVDQWQNECRKFQFVAADFVQSNGDRIKEPPPVATIVLHVELVRFGFFRCDLIYLHFGQRTHSRKPAETIAGNQSGCIDRHVVCLPVFGQMLTAD